MMPKLDGVKTIKELRSKKIDTPVLFLSAKSLIDDKVAGLDAGANDYLTKPFNKKELLARIRALIRTQQSEESQIGNVIFDKENLSLSNNGVTLYLSERESLVLAALEQNKGEIIPIAELKQKTGLAVDTDNNIIKLYISYLQSKFKVLDNCVTVFFNEIGCGLQC
jgi:DNA-binding response OmpR family regulator